MPGLSTIERKYDFNPTHEGKLFADEWNLIADNIQMFIEQTEGDYSGYGAKELYYAIKEIQHKTIYSGSGVNDITIVNANGPTDPQVLENSSGVFTLRVSDVNTGNVRIKASGSAAFEPCTLNGAPIAPGFLQPGKVYLIEHDASTHTYKLLTIGNSDNTASGSGGAGYTIVYVDEDLDVEPSQLLICDTAGETLNDTEINFTLTLPEEPADNTIILFMDGSGNAQERPLLVVSENETIDNKTDDLTCDVNFFDIKLVYNANTQNWALGGK